MVFTSFEVSPLVNTNICHLCFGTGKVKAIQKRRIEESIAEKKGHDNQLSCRQCSGKGVILRDLFFSLK